MTRLGRAFAMVAVGLLAVAMADLDPLDHARRLQR